MDNVTSGAVPPDVPRDYNSQPRDYNYPALVLGVALILCTVLGNVLVCLSVLTERSLKTATNYFIISLAVADLLLAVLVLPLYVYSEFLGGIWTLSSDLCDALMTMDVMLCTASILNLCAISVDRYIAVVVPLKYNRNQFSVRQLALIGATWVLSLVVASPVALGLNRVPGRDPGVCRLENERFVVYSSVCSFFVPCPVMLLLYYWMFRGLRRWSTGRGRSSQVARGGGGGGAGGGRTRRPALSLRLGGAQKTTPPTDLAVPPTAAEGRSPTMTSPSSATTPWTPTTGGSTTLLTTPGGSTTTPGGSTTLLTPTGGSTTPGTEDELRVTAESDPMTTQMDSVSDADAEAGGRGRENGAQAKGDRGGGRGGGGGRQRQRGRRNSKSSRVSGRERKAMKVLPVVVGVFLACWTPFFVVHVTKVLCESCSIGPTLISVVTWLGYVNSAVNPVIYTAFNTEFRIVFHKLLCCRT